MTTGELSPARSGGVAPEGPIPRMPGWLPGLGHNLLMLAAPERFFARMAEGGLTRVQLGPKWHVATARPEHHELLRSPSLSTENYATMGKVVLGNSLLTHDGLEHRRQRREMTKPFTPKGLDCHGTATMMGDIIERHVDQILRAERFICLDAARALTLDVIFGVLGVPNAQIPSWKAHYEKVLLGALPLRLDWPGMPYRKALRSRAWLDEQVRTEIAESRAAGGRPGLLAQMIVAMDRVETDYDRDQLLVDNVLLLALAGHETSASIMTWMACHLAADRQLFERIATEVRTHPSIPHTTAESRSYPLIEALLQECLRLDPPVTTISRVVIEDIEVDGRTIAAGTWLVFPILLWRRDPSRYEHPDALVLERWLGPDALDEPVDRLSFGLGPHYCLGSHIARLESIQFVVALVSRLLDQGKRLRLAGEFPKLQHVFGLSHPRKRATALCLE